MERLIKAFIIWAVRRRRFRYGENSSRAFSQQVVTFDGKHLFRRFLPFWWDEDIHNGKHTHRPPWWRPFNILLHCWRPEVDSESFHDHPRWSITICLRGRIIEKTPWWTRELVPGSVVFRSRKAIHAFEVPKGARGKTWTLFIVGRRNHRQNTYVINPR